MTSFTATDREHALSIIEEISTFDAGISAEEDEAWSEFAGDFVEAYDAVEDAELDREDETTFGMWFAIDRRLESGDRPIDLVLADPALASGARGYLETLADTALRLYEVVEVTIGEMIVLRELPSGRTVRVKERTASMNLERFTLVAARIVEPGVSGEPELERGAMKVPRQLRERLLESIERGRAELRRHNPNAGDLELARGCAALIHQAWLSSFVQAPPELANMDGDPLVWTKLVFRVNNVAEIRSVLAKTEHVEQSPNDRWTWIGPSARNESVSLASITLRGDRLFVEVNSERRAHRARVFIEEHFGGAVSYRAAVLEDVTKKIEEAREQGLPAPNAPDLPEEAIEQATLDYYANHYRKWLDEDVPMFDDRAPREAARDPRLRARVVEALKDLENTYYRQLRDGAPAFDPSWMWSELALEDHADSPAVEVLPARLAHESIAKLVPGFGSLLSDLAGKLRKRPDFDLARTFGPELADHLDVQRFLRKYALHVREAGLEADEAIEDANLLGTWISCALNFELHHRKTFWIGEGLTTMLDETTADPPAELLRLPFASFAMIFSDRHFLGIGERILSRGTESPLAGHKLRCATAYVTEEPSSERRAIRISIAFDAYGLEWPFLVSRVVPIDPAQTIDEVVRAHFADEAKDALLDSERVARLVRIAFNAILYSTSAGVEPIMRKRARPAAKQSGKSRAAVPSDDVFHLPGHIDIKLARGVRAIERTPSGRQILHRFLVRGHWRRPNPDWDDQRLRWIEPYWKGPDMAAVIERSYRLQPDDREI